LWLIHPCVSLAQCCEPFVSVPAKPRARVQAEPFMALQ
jgi:hypothetical protein